MAANGTSVNKVMQHEIEANNKRNRMKCPAFRFSRKTPVEEQGGRECPENAGEVFSLRAGTSRGPTERNRSQTGKARSTTGGLNSPIHQKSPNGSRRTCGLSEGENEGDTLQLTTGQGLDLLGMLKRVEIRDLRVRSA